MIKETTLTGTKDEIKNRIVELEKAGVNQLAILCWNNGHTASCDG